MPPIVHFLVGNQPHFVNHCAPIYQALPDDIRGHFFTRLGTGAHKRLQELNVPYVQWRRKLTKDDIVVVAGYEDYRACNPSRVIFVNHGVGQTYSGVERTATLSAYSGGRNRDRSILFLCPSERDAQINRAAYPDIPAAPVGVPYLDQFHNQPRPIDGPVTISFHADVLACPESRWAWPEYKQAVADLRGKYDLLGHCHPRVQRRLGPWYRSLGIRFEPDFWKVLEVAGCYVIDNSSSGYEAAAIDIPTVWMTPSWYRRDVHHGLRFWDAIPGIQAYNPRDLATAIDIAMRGPYVKRDQALSIAYGGPDGKSLVDGQATRRAVEAIWTTVSSPSAPTSSPISTPA